jgi:hypothetical protein
MIETRTNTRRDLSHLSRKTLSVPFMEDIPGGSVTTTPEALRTSLAVPKAGAAEEDVAITKVVAMQAAAMAMVEAVAMANMDSNLLRPPQLSPNQQPRYPSGNLWISITLTL